MKCSHFTLISFLAAWLIVMSLAGCAGESTAGKNKNTTTATTATKDEATIPTATKAIEKTIIFFGNSLSAGYGLSPEQGFVGLIDQRIDSLGLDYKVVNAGESGETTSGGRSRIDWILENYQADVFVLELGGNDALRGLPVAAAKDNLQAIIDKVKTKNPKVKIVLAGMMAPPNMGNEYTTAFAAMYPQLAKANDAALIPFLLKDVGGMRKLNLADGIHPNVAGHRIVRENVWVVLKGLL